MGLTGKVNFSYCLLQIFISFVCTGAEWRDGIQSRFRKIRAKQPIRKTNISFHLTILGVFSLCGIVNFTLSPLISTSDEVGSHYTGSVALFAI